MISAMTPSEMETAASTAIHELWSPPEENWFDQFILQNKLPSLLRAPRDERIKAKAEILALFTQFAEKAIATDAEMTVQRKKELPPEDISFGERKGACLWLCAFACLAAAEWDYAEALKKVEDVLLLRDVFDHLEGWSANQELTGPMGWPFAVLLVAKWRVYVDTKYRIPPPPAKQTVSNPTNQVDAALARFESSKAAVEGFRPLLPSALAILEGYVKDGRDIPAPSVDTFLLPFLEECGLSLSVGLAGLNVLVEGVPLPRISEAPIILKGRELSAKCHAELAGSYLVQGKFTEAARHVRKLLPLQQEAATPETLGHPLLTLDQRAVNGFCQAFGFRLAHPQLDASTSFHEGNVSGMEEKQFTGPAPSTIPQRKFGMRRWRTVEGAQSSTPTQQSTIAIAHAENLAEDLAAGVSVVGWRHKTEGPTGKGGEIAVDRLVKALLRLLAPTSRLTPSAVKRTRATIRLLTASHPSFATAFHKEGVDAALVGGVPPTISLDHIKTGGVPLAAPSATTLKCMAASDKPYWTLLTSFDSDELKVAFEREKDYRRPLLLRFPDLLAEWLLQIRPVNELKALLLGKLYQMTEIGNAKRWEEEMNKYTAMLELSQDPEFLARVLFEASRVKAVCESRRMLNPHSFREIEKEDFVFQLIEKINNKSKYPQMIIPICSYLLNHRQDVALNYIMQNIDIITVVVFNVSKVLAAYSFSLQNRATTQQQMRHIAAAFHALVAGNWESTAALKRRTDGSSAREAPRNRGELQTLFRGIKHTEQIAFLVTYWALAYTNALAARGRGHLKVFAELAPMFAEAKFAGDSMHLVALEDTLTGVLTTALEVQPWNASWLRTAADFAYVRNQLDAAEVHYMECLFASRASLAPPFDSALVDESVWAHLRVCLRRRHETTLAVSVCQLFKTGRAKEYRKAAESIAERECHDTSDECFGFIFDTMLGEYLSDAYAKKGMQHTVDALIRELSRPAMNSNNGGEIGTREKTRRQARLLKSLAANALGVHF